MKLFLVLFLISSSFCIYAQEDKWAILKEFEVVEYYPNSTIMLASKSKNHVKQGYSIEFKKNGDPYCIGKYKNGIKLGLWKYYDGSFMSYEKGLAGNLFYSGCGTGLKSAIQSFEKLYLSLVYPNKKQKK